MLLFFGITVFFLSITEFKLIWGIPTLREIALIVNSSKLDKFWKCFYTKSRKTATLNASFATNTVMDYFLLFLLANSASKVKRI